MDNILYVLSFCTNLLNTRLTFSPFSFTILQVLISLFALRIVVDFVIKIFEE